jgi:hypothetical protein
MKKPFPPDDQSRELKPLQPFTMRSRTTPLHYPNWRVRLYWLRKPVPAKAILAEAMQSTMQTARLRSQAAHQNRALLRSVTLDALRRKTVAFPACLAGTIKYVRTQRPFREQNSLRGPVMIPARVYLGHPASELVIPAADQVSHRLHVLPVAGKTEAAEVPTILDRCQHRIMVGGIVGGASATNGL